MAIVTIQEAQAGLSDLIHKRGSGDYRERSTRGEAGPDRTEETMAV